MSLKNQLKTAVLLGALTGVLLVIGGFFGRQGLTIAFIIAILMNFFSYWFSDKIVLKMYRAREVKKKDRPELYNMVKEVAEKANIPMPKVYITPTKIPNAFATGRNPENSAVAFTEGILEELDKEELKGVTAHEISHIKNRDTLISTVAATIAAVISYVAFMARFAAIFGGMRGNRDGGNIFELLVMAILAPLIATMIQLAISRSREYLADESGAKILKSGKGLASGLEKLHKASKQYQIRPTSTTQSTAHLFIVNPFSAKGLTKLFSTHPPMEERVKRLRSMKF